MFKELPFESPKACGITRWTEDGNLWFMKKLSCVGFLPTSDDLSVEWCRIAFAVRCATVCAEKVPSVLDHSDVRQLNFAMQSLSEDTALSATELFIERVPNIYPEMLVEAATASAAVNIKHAVNAVDTEQDRRWDSWDTEWTAGFVCILRNRRYIHPVRVCSQHRWHGVTKRQSLLCTCRRAERPNVRMLNRKRPC